MITFIPNDPLAKTGPAARRIKARAKRPAGRADFTFTGKVAEAEYNVGTPEFLFWQCREAALLALEVWEKVDGRLKEWGPSSPKRLTLTQNAGFELNAGYTQFGLEFYEFTTGTKTTFSGASTDVVSHESGHAFLDSLRPDLWTSSFPETNAFHEAFGDCVAILTALSDKEMRESLLKTTANLSKKNFVATLMEDLADGIKRENGVDFDASAPRNALNSFKWQLPTTLPTSGKPAVLTSEVHSFGRVFAGCFYDTLRNVFSAQAKKDQGSLWQAAKTVGKILTVAAREAPETPRFFQSVGRAMILADQKINKGAHRTPISDAFTRHAIALGSAAMLAPRSSLAGAAPRMGGKKGAAILTPTTRDDLKRRIGAPPTARMSVTTRSIGDQQVAEATHHREVSLGALSKDLQGVVVFAAEPVLVGSSGNRAAILSAMPDENVTTDEVHTFVRTLLENDRIAFGDDSLVAPAARGFRAAGPIAAGAKSRRPLPTHAVRVRGNQKVLQRIRFIC